MKLGASDSSAAGKRGNRSPRTGPSSPGSSRETRNRRAVKAGIALLACVLLGATLLGWLAYKAEQIRSSLEPTPELLARFQTELTVGDAEGASRTLDELRDRTARARAAGSDPLWRAAAALPLVGANFSTISEISVSAHDVVGGALVPIADHIGSLDWESLKPINGTIDVAPIQALAPKMTAAANTIEFSHGRLSAIDRSTLHSAIAKPLDEVTASLASAKDRLQRAATATHLLPPMLGAGESRNYLLLVQNNAEVRATGGIPGALAVITADGGKVALTAQGTANGIGRFDPALMVDADQELIYSKRLGAFMQSVNLTPDFPTAAQTAAQMWESRNEGTSIDGVLALDPVALSYMLGATGPVELVFEDPAIIELVIHSGLPQTLTSENVVPTLLSQVYSSIEEPRLQDAYFAAVAAQIFDAFVAGSGDGTGLISSLIRSSEEGRLYLWSADPSEQENIASTDLAGSVTGPGTGGAAFGAYFNDGTGAKMDFYMRRTVQLTRTCMPEGYLRYTLKTTLTNTAPADAAESLPPYVTGAGAFGVPAGTVQTNFVGYGPNKAQLQTARLNGSPTPLGSYRHGDRPVGMLTMTLAPGETAKVELDFTAVVQQSEPTLDVTPTIQPLNEVILPVEGAKACN